MKRLLILLLPLFFLQCSSLSSLWYDITKKESTYYNDSEKQILEETTAAIDFRYGFDPDIEIDYIYRAGSFPDKELEGKSKKMLDVLKKYEKQKVIEFYEKIYMLKEIQSVYMANAQKDEEWGDFTLIQKYILPDTEKYVEMLEKNVLLIDENYKKIIEERKGEIRKQVEAEFAD